MATEKQIAANRLNALKSTGPRTSEGKAVCSKNARRHRHLAESVLLATENTKRFCNLVERFHREYQPEGATERALVDMMAVARWRMLRMSSLEAAGIDHEYRQLRNEDTPVLSVPVRASLSYRNLADGSRGLDLIGRSEARHQRQFDSAFDRLSRLRAERSDPQDPNSVIPPRPDPATDTFLHPGDAL